MLNMDRLCLVLSILSLRKEEISMKAHSNFPVIVLFQIILVQIG